MNGRLMGATRQGHYPQPRGAGAAVDRALPRRYRYLRHARAGTLPRGHRPGAPLQRAALLADGSSIELGTAVGRIEFMGKIVGGTLVFGDADAEPRLGVTALESGGFEVDPRTQRLRKLPAVPLKATRRAGDGRPSARRLGRRTARTPGGLVGRPAEP